LKNGWRRRSTLVPGVESQTFPGAPLGYLVPGDHLPNGQAIPDGIAPTPKDNFSPRFGIAYSPSWSDGFLGTLTGGPGKTSIHIGAGRFFSSPEGLTCCVLLRIPISIRALPSTRSQHPQRFRLIRIFRYLAVPVSRLTC
jgi:hypothetical protein